MFGIWAPRTLERLQSLLGELCNPTIPCALARTVLGDKVGSVRRLMAIVRVVEVELAITVAVGFQFIGDGCVQKIGEQTVPAPWCREEEDAVGGAADWSHSKVLARPQLSG